MQSHVAEATLKKFRQLALTISRVWGSGMGVSGKTMARVLTDRLADQQGLAEARTPCDSQRQQVPRESPSQ
jgi:hypothetical protein